MTLCFASVLSNLLTVGSNPNNLAIRLFLMSMKCQSHAQHNGLSLMLHKTALLSQTDRIGHMQTKFKCTQTGVFHGHIFKIKKGQVCQWGKCTEIMWIITCLVDQTAALRGCCSLFSNFWTHFVYEYSENGSVFRFKNKNRTLYKPVRTTTRAAHVFIQIHWHILTLEASKAGIIVWLDAHWKRTAATLWTFNVTSQMLSLSKNDIIVLLSSWRPQ